MSTLAIPIDEWSFVFAGFAPGTGYYAGRVLTDGTATREPITISNGITGSSLTSGQSSAIGRSWGDSHLRIWSKNPSNAEIVARFRSRLKAASEVGLVRQWWTEEGAGSVTDDVTGAVSSFFNVGWQSVCAP